MSGSLLRTERKEGRALQEKKQHLDKTEFQRVAYSEHSETCLVAEA